MHSNKAAAFVLSAPHPRPVLCLADAGSQSAFEMTSPHRTTYLCPSDRAARAFQVLLARDSVAAPSCVDFERFCADLWRRGQLFGLIADARELVDVDASVALWHAVVADETGLTQSEAARVAGLAVDAWTLAHRYGLPLRQLPTLTSGQDNLALFARCAIRMQALLQRVGAITQPELYAQLLLLLDGIQTLLPESVVLTPAFTVHPGQKQLLSALAERGVSITHRQPAAGRKVPCKGYEISDEQQEMRAAITWAKAQVDSAPNIEQSVAIIVPNLSRSRARWLTALREHLNPDNWWLNPETDRARFNLSVAEPLAASPFVASLITVLSATVGSVDTEVLAQALMHPRWGRSALSLQRLQRHLWRMLERGAYRCSLSYWLDLLPTPARAVLNALRHPQAQVREAHRDVLLALCSALTEQASIAQSELFQLEEAWADALRRWSAMDRWLPPMPWHEAAREIGRMADGQTFQPQSGRARIQVMGLLESAGVPFDAAWIVGFTDRVLPESYKPHAMLPRAWQTAEQVGLGSRDEVHRRADALWKNWNQLCGELHVSYASDVDGSAQRISPLAASVALQPVSPLALQSAHLRTAISSTLHDETLPGAIAQEAKAAQPPLTAGMLEQQSHCPRKAAAARLHLREWPEYALGIPARLRGQMVHDVMHAVGATRIQQARDNGNEPTLEVLHSVAAEAFKYAVEDARQKRPAIPVSVWAIERDRLLPLIDKVLAMDATRSGFTVIAVEEAVQTEVLGSAFKLRVDRRDSFTAAGSDDERYGVVFDYKTGIVTRADLFAENTSGRLAAPQLPLYMFALHAALPENEPRIGAIGYIVISDDDVKFVGVGADAALNPRRADPDEPDWYDLTLAWRDQLGTLIDEHRAGVADVAPLKGTATCRYCAYAAFCREPWSLSGTNENAEDENLSGSEAQP